VFAKRGILKPAYGAKLDDLIVEGTTHTMNFHELVLPGRKRSALRFRMRRGSRIEVTQIWQVAA
jgi:hypothetical protein